MFVMGDGNWLLAMREYAAGRADAAFMVGGGLVGYVVWLAATGIGFGLGSLIPDPKRFAIDFLLIAFFAVMAATMWRSKRDIAPFAIAALAAIATERLIAGPWYLIAGAVAGSLAGLFRPVGENETDV
jgi:predicted branched-subunit amino acid permease